MSTMTAVSQRYPQSVMHCFHYLGAKTLNISHWVWGGPFSAAVPNSIQAEMGNDARKNKTNKQKSVLDCADLDKQKPQTILQRTRTGDISFRRATSDCIVFNLTELEFLYPLFLWADVVLTHCQTCVLNSLSWPWRWVDPLRTLSSEGRCSDGSLFDTCLEGSEVVLKNRDIGHKSDVDFNEKWPFFTPASFFLQMAAWASH